MFFVIDFYFVNEKILQGFYMVSLMRFCSFLILLFNFNFNFNFYSNAQAQQVALNENGYVFFIKGQAHLIRNKEKINLSKNLKIHYEDKIVVEDKSLVIIKVGNYLTTKIEAHSELTILPRESGNNLKENEETPLFLEKGSAFFQLIKMIPAKKVTIKAQNVAMGIRGTDDHPIKIWKFFTIAQLMFILTNISHNPENFHGVYLYLFSALPLMLLGFYALNSLPKDMTLKRYNGLYQEKKFSYQLFMMCFLGLSGYPFTSIFWSEEILFAELLTDSPGILFFTTISIMLNGLIVGRVLVKTFWGYPAVTYR